MAEILLSLTIIGVVAAITLPSLTGNINERTWNTQRKALYARFSQAIALMPALNGYGTLTEDENGSVTADTAAETFVTEGLSKVLKINNICDSEHLADCGLPSKITDLNGGTPYSEFPKTLLDFNDSFSYNKSGSAGWNPSYSQKNTKAAAFETQNGESIAVYYNPFCRIDNGAEYDNIQPYMCANFVYDLNGNKGPNTVGKDIGFITAMYPVDSVVVAPIPTHGYSELMTLESARNTCRNLSDESRMPNIEEISSLFYNFKLIGSNIHFNDTWSSTYATTDKVKYVHFGTGLRNIKVISRGDKACTLCVKRL